MNKLRANLYYISPSENHLVVDLREGSSELSALEAKPMEVAIQNAREIESSLDVHGFTLVPFRDLPSNPFDSDLVKRDYYPKVEELVRSVTGNQKVKAFDHNVRNFEMAKRSDLNVQKPVHLVHNDYTLESGPKRMKELMGKEAESLAKKRFAIINVWKPLVGPVQQSHLAVCDGRTIQEQDLKLIRLDYANRKGMIQGVCHNSAHHWYYFPAMTIEEAILLKCFDSNEAVTRHTAHSAFRDRNMPKETPARQSIEVRTIAFY